MRRPAVLLGLGLYALILVVAPLLEHDFDCHLKSRTHCNMCVASPPASCIESCVSVAPARLPEAGRVETAHEGPVRSDIRLNLPGRSPPA